MSEDIIPEALPNGGEGTVDETKQPLHKALSEALGKEFTSDEAAIKSIKDTFDYVGGMGQYKETMSKLKETWALDSDAAVLEKMKSLKETKPSSSTDIEGLKAWKDEVEFYNENPDLKAHKALLNELRGSTGKSLKEVAESEIFKDTIEKVQVGEQHSKTRSVLESNSRLGKVRDKMKEAATLSKEGNQQAAESAAVGAVLDAFNE